MSNNPEIKKPVLGRSEVLHQRTVYKPAVKMPPGYFGAIQLPERSYILTVVKTEIVQP